MDVHIDAHNLKPEQKAAKVTCVIAWFFASGSLSMMSLRVDDVTKGINEADRDADGHNRPHIG